MIRATPRPATHPSPLAEARHARDGVMPATLVRAVSHLCAMMSAHKPPQPERDPLMSPPPTDHRPLGQSDAASNSRVGEPVICARCSEPAPFAPVTLTILGDAEHYHMACWAEFLQTGTPPNEREIVPLSPGANLAT